MLINDHKEFINLIRIIKSHSDMGYSLMGLDVGGRTVGVAFYHSAVNMTLPSHTIMRVPNQNQNQNEFLELVKIIKERNISGIVVGWPLSPEGGASRSTGTVEEFITKFIKFLENNDLDIPITLYDERYTTSMANKMLKATGMKREERDKKDNEIAASIILDNFMTRYSVIN